MTVLRADERLAVLWKREGAEANTLRLGTGQESSSFNLTGLI